MRAILTIANWSVPGDESINCKVEFESVPAINTSLCFQYEEGGESFWVKIFAVEIHMKKGKAAFEAEVYHLFAQADLEASTTNSQKEWIKLMKYLEKKSPA